DADADGPAPADDPSGLRHEAEAGVLGAQARLDRMAAGLETREQLALCDRYRLAGGDAQLPLDEIDVDELLGQRVLDLQPRVHLDEPERAASVEQELDCAGAAVADRARDRDGGVAHRSPERGRHRRRGRFLDDLLVAPLQRAVALAEMDDVAVRVGEDLDLDVARADRLALEEETRIAERSVRFGRRRG